MGDKQQNERSATRFEGVYQRASRVKRHNGRPDVCYSIDFRDPQTGKRVRKTIGWASKGITAGYAATVRDGLIKRGVDNKFAGLAPRDEADIPTLGQAWELYRDDYLRANQIKSEKDDTSRFNNHLAALAPMRIHQIRKQDLDRLCAGLIASGRSPQTAHHVLALVRRVMNKMIEWDYWVGPTPFGRQFKMPRLNNERRRYFTASEANAVIEALKHLSPRMWLISLISLHTGLRFGSVAALTYGDLNFKNRTILVRDPKNGRDHFAVMTGTLADALATLPTGGREQLLFPTNKGGVMRQALKIFDEVIDAFELNAGVTDRRMMAVFHTLRHSYASLLAEDGTGQRMIKELMHHSSMEMSVRYTHLMPDRMRETAETFDRLLKNAEHQEPQK